MKFTTNKFFRIFAILTIIAVFVFSYIYYDNLLNIFTEYLYQYSYFGLGLFAALLEGIPQMLSTDILIIISQLIGLNMITALLVIILGSTIGSLIAFYIGYKYGKKVALLFITKKKFKQVTDFMQKYDRYALPLISFAPLPYFPIIFGVLKIDFKDFLLYGITTRAIKHSALVGLVYYLYTNNIIDNLTDWL